MKRTPSQKNGKPLLICSYCKRILRSEKPWWQKKTGFGYQAKSGISHSICPDCLLEHFPHEYLAIQEEKRLRIKNEFKKGF